MGMLRGLFKFTVRSVTPPQLLVTEKHDQETKGAGFKKSEWGRQIQNEVVPSSIH